MANKFNQNLEISSKKTYKLYGLIELLIENGYERVEEIYSSGQFILTGDTLTIFPVNNQNHIRINFFGDSVESIYHLSENKKEKVNEITIEPNILTLGNGEIIRPGQYIVHIDQGIGIFKSFGIKVVNNQPKKYIFLEYLNNSFLYLPYSLKDNITSYIGVGKRHPKLSKIGSGAWQRTKKRAYESILALTKELLLIYAKREIIKKNAYKIDRTWDEEIKKSFDFVETADQAKAIDKVYSDLQKDVPTDRLICGDVGFGKTEIAIRAAVQAMANGHQAALLCPTTILAEQHFATFSLRMKNLPVRIAKLSRFYNKSKQKEVLEDLKNGKVDFVIGTHRLLSKDIEFKNLDLIIIDEEQRFGVKQKEKFKKLREVINILTLTATPIPRTLFMALSGIRDISEINIPPAGRRSIETEVKKNDAEIINQYIDRELKRRGQIYYLHNKVHTIEGTANKLRRDFPKSKIAVAHGQMDEKTLAETMSKFTGGEVDILVCSTIIENGLDLPNVNTIIIEEAERFGLAQLYQIRGRIGRGERQAYCLLLHNENKLTQEARKRLTALMDNSQLGAGFNIALSDLEIRGGGNILGREQHGTMEAVGLVLYTKLLKQAVDKIKPQ